MPRGSELGQTGRRKRAEAGPAMTKRAGKGGRSEFVKGDAGHLLMETRVQLTILLHLRRELRPGGPM